MIKISYILSLFILQSLLFASQVELEVLGSGGPELDGRASTSYLLWVDHEAKLIVDMGSGSMLRFEQSGAELETLEAVVLTHLHIDHSVDLPAFVKAGFFSRRREALDIVAPSGNAYFPSCSGFLDALFGEGGAYPYMQDVLREDSDSFEILPIDIEASSTRDYPTFQLTLMRVYHGIVPALAVRIDVRGKSIIISGDTNNKNHTLEKLAKNADLFIAHHAIAQNAKGYATSLHMKPSMIAAVAEKADVKKVVLTHRMRRTLKDEKQTLQEIKKRYKGKVIFAEDSMKIEL